MTKKGCLVILCTKKIMKDAKVDIIYEFDRNLFQSQVKRAEFKGFTERWCLFVYKLAHPTGANTSVNIQSENFARDNNRLANLTSDEWSAIAYRVLPRAKFAYKITSRGILISLRKSNIEQSIKIKDWLACEGLECDLVQDMGRLDQAYELIRPDSAAMSSLDT